MNIIYLWSALISIVGLYLLWAYGFRPLMVDEFRSRIGALRAELNRLADDGCISTEAAAFLFLESLLSGLIWLAPNLSMVEFAIFILKRGITQRHATSQLSVNFEASLVLLQPYSQQRLREINVEASRLTLSFILRRIPFSAAMSYFMYLHASRSHATHPMYILTGQAHRFGTQQSHYRTHTDDHVAV